MSTHSEQESEKNFIKVKPTIIKKTSNDDSDYDLTNLTDPSTSDDEMDEMMGYPHPMPNPMVASGILHNVLSQFLEYSNEENSVSITESILMLNETLNGVRDSIDKNSKCILKLKEEATKLREVQEYNVESRLKNLIKQELSNKSDS